MHVRIVQRGSWKKMELKLQKKSDSQILVGIICFVGTHLSSVL